MKKVVVIVLIAVFGSCKNTSINPDLLYHTWKPTLFYQNKNEKGEWSAWKEHQQLWEVTLSFTTDGKILYNNKPATSCCSFYNFKLNKDKIQLLNPSNSPDCALIECASQTQWKILKISNEELELEQYNYRTRYTR